MTELLEVVASWPSLLLVLLVFGFAPGFCLRLIILAYPRSDPRRKELIAELYAVSRIQRPLWVAEQLEVALFEGLGHHVSAAIRLLVKRRANLSVTELTEAEQRRHAQQSTADRKLKILLTQNYDEYIRRVLDEDYPDAR